MSLSFALTGSEGLESSWVPKDDYLIGYGGDKDIV
jgi:hypothetical protein